MFGFPRWLKLSAGLAVCVAAAVALQWVQPESESAPAGARSAPQAPEPEASRSVDHRCPPGMAFISGGELAGVPEPVRDFCLAREEVTVAAYRACVEAGDCEAPGTKRRCNWEREAVEDHPINCVTWGQADTYCSARHTRLPTEWEWEWAAQGGVRDRSQPWGETAPDPFHANLCFNECRRQMVDLPVDRNTKLTDGWVLTSPVGIYPEGASPEGVLDLVGNVGEWTSTPVERQEGHYVFRGASWYHHQTRDLVKQRFHAPGSEPDSAVGFRCAAFPDEH